MLAKKAPNPIDKHIGARIRVRRLQLGMSQEKLGDALGLTFQQVQKYEKGVNRVGGSRMAAIANVLKLSGDIGWFYSGLSGNGAGNVTVDDSASQLVEFATKPHAAALVDHFLKLDDRDRATVVDLAARLASG